jgi:hypothetical protein
MYDFETGRFGQRDLMPLPQLAMSKTSSNVIGLFKHTALENSVSTSVLKNTIFGPQYSYANNVVSLVDPDGLCPWCIVPIIFLFLTGCGDDPPPELGCSDPDGKVGQWNYIKLKDSGGTLARTEATGGFTTLHCNCYANLSRRPCKKDAKSGYPTWRIPEPYQDTFTAKTAGNAEAGSLVANNPNAACAQICRGDAETKWKGLPKVE